MVSEEKVKHIANLANLKVTDMVKYQRQLTDILSEIDKILEIDIKEDIMISPSKEINKYRDDVCGESIDNDELFENSKNKYDNYIRVPKVIE